VDSGTLWIFCPGWQLAGKVILWTLRPPCQRMLDALGVGEFASFLGSWSLVGFLVAAPVLTPLRFLSVPPGCADLPSA